jgi:hypothetical protein
VLSSSKVCARCQVCSACCQAEPASHGVARSFGVDVRFVLAPVSVRRLPLVLCRHRWDLRVFALAAAGLRFRSLDQLPWAYALLQSPPDSEPPSRRRTLLQAAANCIGSAPPMRFVAPSAYPRTRQRPVDALCLTASPAPSGFLNLSTLWSATCLLALFHARSAHGVVPFRALLPSRGRTLSPAPFPS